MRLNLWLVRASQFLQQFKLDVRHNPGKEYIIPHALNQLASANIGQVNPFYLELEALFAYNTILVKICPELISRILAGYEVDNYWSRFQRQIQANKDLGADKTPFLFVLGSILPTNAKLYLTPHLEDEAKLLPVAKVSRTLEKLLLSDNTDSFLPLDKTKLFYYVNKLTGFYHLCISLSIAPNILAIAHREGHLGFSRCYKIITDFWFIRRLTKLLQTFICHCPQCLAL